MNWGRALVGWIALIGAEVVHGTARTLWLAPWLGDFRARQVSVFTGSLVIVVISYLVSDWLSAWTTRAQLRVGLLWLVLTVTFEIALGLALGYSWARIGADYNFLQGGLMPIGLIALLLAPWLAARLRRGAFS